MLKRKSITIVHRIHRERKGEGGKGEERRKGERRGEEKGGKERRGEGGKDRGKMPL